MLLERYPYLSVFIVLFYRRATCQESNHLPVNCGISVHNDLAYRTEPRVFSYPWMAIIRYNRSTVPTDLTDGCTGSLINKRYVLTAGHCLSNLGSIQLHSVVLGEHTKGQAIDCNVYRDGDGVEIDSDCAGPVEEYRIASIKVHPEYDQRQHSNDIGLIRLDRDVSMDDHIRPVCLPVTQELREKLFKRYVVTSWNHTDALLEAAVRHISNEDCQESFKKMNSSIKLSDTQICTEGVDIICHGSGGGPLGMETIYHGSYRFVQFGIVSVGSRACNLRNHPEVFTRVASYMDWILESIKS